VLLLASVIVAMHVFATALGHRLQLRTERERLRQVAETKREEFSESASEQTARIAAIRSAPRSPWHDRGRTYLPWLPRFIVGAMFLGGAAGAIFLSGAIGHRASPTGIVVGATSFAVVSGWFAFLGGNFYGVFRQGFRDALTGERENGNSSAR
jgi:predicted phage tail protein